MIKRNLLFIIIIILIIPISYISFKLLLSYLREQNLIHIGYNIEEGRRLKTDYAFAPIRVHLLNNEYHLDTDEKIESEAVIDVKIKIPKILKHIQEKKFYNYWRLTAFLQSEGKYSLEKELLEYLLTESKFFDIDYEYENFINYLNEYYISSSRELIKNHQYTRAKWMIDQALERLLIIDTKPLSFLSGNYRNYLNNLLIQRLLIENPENANTETKKFQSLYKLYRDPMWSAPNLDEINELQIRESSKYFGIVQYIIGTKKLKEGKTKEAFNIFKKVDEINQNQNEYLTNLNMHLLARCIFWHCHNNDLKNKTKSINQLKRIIDKIQFENLKTDIEYYISFLKTPPNSYHNEPKPENNDDSDFIIKLNL